MNDFELNLINFYIKKFDKEDKTILFFVRCSLYNDFIDFVENNLKDRFKITRNEAVSLNGHIKIFSVRDYYENFRGYRASVVFADSGLGEEFYNKIARPIAKEDCFLIHI